MPHKCPQIVQPLQKGSFLPSPGSLGPQPEAQDAPVSHPYLVAKCYLLPSSLPHIPHDPFQVLTSLLDCSPTLEVCFSGPQTIALYTGGSHK